jgi:hypothetical protein
MSGVGTLHWRQNNLKLSMKAVMSMLFFPLAFGTFFVDICASAFSEKQVIYLALCLYISQLFSAPSWWRLSFLAIIIALESFFYYGTFGIDLIYLLPATLIGLHMRTALDAKTVNRFLLLAACIFIQNLVVNSYLLQASNPATYTVTKILANMGLMLLFR